MNAVQSPAVAFMTILPILFMLGSLAVSIYLIVLAARFVKAVEKIADKFEPSANRPGTHY